jgi:hypothetical protein
MSIIAPDDFSTLALQEQLLDGAFNQTFEKALAIDSQLIHIRKKLEKLRNESKLSSN